MKEYPHVFTAPGLVVSTALVFGKGPTFDPLMYYQVPGLEYLGKVYAINQAAMAVRKFVEPDMVVCCDLEPMLDLQRMAKGCKFKALAAPVIPHRGENPHGPFDYSLLADTFENIYLFDMFTGGTPRYAEPVFYVKTTYNAVLEIATYHGSKVIYTNGVDGGAGRHPLFQDTHQVNVPDYDAQFEMEKRMTDTRGVRFIRLKG